MSDASQAPVEYVKRASQTKAGKDREDEFLHALGRFVVNFSRAETALQAVLWHYAKTHETIARCLFSGVHIDVGMNYIRRIAEATNAPKEDREDLDRLFAQLRVINKVRNDILHHGIHSDAEGNAFLTNALLAHLPQNVTVMPISVEELNKMTTDVRQIVVTLIVRHAGRMPVQSDENRRALEEFVRAPWRYKPLVRRSLRCTTEEKYPRSRKRPPKPPRQPEPSRP